MKHAVIRIKNDDPDFRALPKLEFELDKTVYGNISESIAENAPPLGKLVTLIHYLDANLMHFLFTGRSVTGILFFINNTTIDWFSNKQATVETTTYVS